MLTEPDEPGLLVRDLSVSLIRLRNGDLDQRLNFDSSQNWLQMTTDQEMVSFGENDHNSVSFLILKETIDWSKRTAPPTKGLIVSARPSSRNDCDFEMIILRYITIALPSEEMQHEPTPAEAFEHGRIFVSGRPTVILR